MSSGDFSVSLIAVVTPLFPDEFPRPLVLRPKVVSGQIAELVVLSPASNYYNASILSNVLNTKLLLPLRKRIDTIQLVAFSPIQKFINSVI